MWPYCLMGLKDVYPFYHSLGHWPHVVKKQTDERNFSAQIEFLCTQNSDYDLLFFYTDFISNKNYEEKKNST